MEYRREIDGLRALAVLPVILFHAGFKAFSGGFVGVDVFFVISGYLITSIILAELEIGKFSIINFYERRARRILPALFVVMFACLPFAWLWLLPSDMKSFSESLVAVSFFASNFLFWMTSGYFDTAAELKPLLHTWSLAVEEQYYVLFPMFLLVTWRLGRRWIVALLSFLFVVSLVAAHWGAYTHPSPTFYLLPTRGWELLIGVFVSFHLASRNRKLSINQSINQSISIVGLLLITYTIFAFDSNTPFPSIYALIPTVGTALIILGANSETLVGKLLGTKLLVGVGLISYSAYLWHQPLFAFARHWMFEQLSTTVTMLLVVLTFLASYLSWKYVEAPFRNKGHFDRSQVFKYALMGSLFFISIGTIGHVEDGFEDTYVSAYDGDVGHIAFHKYVADKYFRCTPESIAKDAQEWEGFLRCMQSKKDADVDIALLGDSHAEHLFLGIAESLENRNVAFYIKSSHPFLGNPKFDMIFKHILNTKSIHTVLLTMQWGGLFNQIPANTTFEEELLKTVNALVSAGKNVYLLDDIPTFSFPPERCKFLARVSHERTCDASKVQVLKYEKQYLPTLRSVSAQAPGVHFLEIRNLLCSDMTCSMVKDGVLMYRDPNHLNIPGSRYVGAAIARRFTEFDR